MPNRRPNIASLFLHYARLDRKRTGGGLSPSEQEVYERLRVRLNQELSPAVPKEVSDRRGSIRVPIFLPCTCQSANGVQAGTVLNISRTGVFVSVSAPTKVGERVWLGLRTDPEGDEIHIPGVVATAPRGSQSGGETGIGVRFVLDVPNLLSAIDDLYQWAIVRAFGPGAVAEQGDGVADAEPASEDAAENRSMAARSGGT